MSRKCIGFKDILGLVAAYLAAGTLGVAGAVVGNRVESAFDLNAQRQYALVAAKCDQILMKDNRDLIRLPNPSPSRKIVAHVRIYRIERGQQFCTARSITELPSSAHIQALFSVQKHYFVSQVYRDEFGTRWFVTGRWPDGWWGTRPYQV